MLGCMIGHILVVVGWVIGYQQRLCCTWLIVGTARCDACDLRRMLSSAEAEACSCLGLLHSLNQSAGTGRNTMRWMTLGSYHEMRWESMSVR